MKSILKKVLRYRHVPCVELGYISLFLLLLALPLIANFIHFNDSNTEKRTLSPKPVIKLTPEFSQEYERYFNDHFGFRSLIIKTLSNIKFNYFKASPKPESVIIGKNGYLFYNSKSEFIYDSYSKNNLLTKEELKELLDHKNKLINELAAKNITYVQGFWPNKHTIYPEHLPYIMRIQIKQTQSLADQLVDYFNNNNLPYFDIREELIEAKSSQNLYYKHDTHWNNIGAYLAYVAFCNKSYNQLKLKAFDWNKFELKNEIINKGDLTQLIAIDSTKYTDNKPIFTLKDSLQNFKIIEDTCFPSNTVITINEHCGNKKVVAIFRDSYTNALIQFISLHYYKVVYIKNNHVSLETIEKIKPNIVISACVERYIPSTF